MLVSVSDTGGGISAEDIPKLFKEFGQANNDHARQFAGTGLGLSICKELVELHGGQISVKSTLGKGATFEFTLPATSEAAPEDDGSEYEPSSDTLEMFGGLDAAGYVAVWLACGDACGPFGSAFVVRCIRGRLYSPVHVVACLLHTAVSCKSSRIDHKTPSFAKMRPFSPFRPMLH